MELRTKGFIYFFWTCAVSIGLKIPVIFVRAHGDECDGCVMHVMQVYGCVMHVMHVYGCVMHVMHVWMCMYV